MSQELEPKTTIHTIKTYKILYTPEQQDYFFEAQIGKILNVQTSLGNSGNFIYVTIQHINIYNKRYNYHIKAVPDNKETYLNDRFEYHGRLNLRCTPDQKSSISEETEKTSLRTIPVNIFIKQGGV